MTVARCRYKHVDDSTSVDKTVLGDAPAAPAVRQTRSNDPVQPNSGHNVARGSCRCQFYGTRALWLDRLQLPRSRARPRRCAIAGPCASSSTHELVGSKSSLGNKLADFVVCSLTQSPKAGKSIGTRLISDSSTDRFKSRTIPSSRDKGSEVRINTAGYYVRSTP